MVEAINSLWMPAIYYIFLIPELWRSEPYPSSSHPSVELMHLPIELNTYYLKYPRALGKLTSLRDFYAIASIVGSSHELNIFMRRPAFCYMDNSKLTWKRILEHIFHYFFFLKKKNWTVNRYKGMSRKQIPSHGSVSANCFPFLEAASVISFWWILAERMYAYISNTHIHTAFCFIEVVAHSFYTWHKIRVLVLCWSSFCIRM